MEEKKDWKEELQDIINREMFKEDLMIQIKSLVEQELDRAREEGREEVRQLLRDKKQMQKFLKENPKFYKGKKIETTGVATLTKF